MKKVTVRGVLREKGAEIIRLVVQATIQKKRRNKGSVLRSVHPSSVNAF